MNNYIKSALSRIKAEDELIKETEKNLRIILERQKEKKLKFSAKRIVIAVCVVFLICGMSIGGYTYYKTPVAYLSLDINPSVELGVNAFNKVVSATGYNEDGKTILKGQNILNSNIKDAINTLVKSASYKRFVASNGSTIISVTSETDNASVAARLEKAAEQGANDALKATGDTAVVYKDNVALSRRDEAKKLDITPGKLNLIKKLQAKDPTATVEQYKDAKVTDIMKKIVELTKSGNTADPSSHTDIKNIEKAVEQMGNNIQSDENNSDNGTVTTTNTDKINGNNSASSATASSNEENGSNNSQQDKKDTSAASPTTAEETVRQPGNNNDNNNTQSDENNSDNGTVTTSTEKENAKKSNDNSDHKDNNNENESASSSEATSSSTADVKNEKQNVENNKEDKSAPSSDSTKSETESQNTGDNKSETTTVNTNSDNENNNGKQ